MADNEFALIGLALEQRLNGKRLHVSRFKCCFSATARGFVGKIDSERFWFDD